MAVYAIGDVQGCFDELQRLLERLAFDPTEDTLWFAGDLINRGPKSLEVLRFVRHLGSSAITVLGNHDLHLLAISQGNLSHYKHGSLQDILHAPDREELIQWLRQRPLMYRDQELGYNLIHAGLPPQWDIPSALLHAREIEATLQGKGFHDFCHHMYGNEPSKWSHDLDGMARLRFITNSFTRLRYCTSDGSLALREKGPPGNHRVEVTPWFEVPDRASRNDRIVFGHWSTLGYHHANNVWGIDTGCLWGGQLTALEITADKPPEPIHCPCHGALKPGNQ